MNGFKYKTTLRFALTGPQGGNLDKALMFAIELGMTAEPMPGGYRLAGSTAGYRGVQGWIEHYKPAGPIECAVERPPAGRNIGFFVAPGRASRRSSFIHGLESATDVARAIDCGLTVTSAGVLRFHVTGTTTGQARWLAKCTNSTLDEALKQMGLTRETAAAEDAAAPEISIHLPPREITSEIVRDRAGNITSVTQTEVTK